MKKIMLVIAFGFLFLCLASCGKEETGSKLYYNSETHWYLSSKGKKAQEMEHVMSNWEVSSDDDTLFTRHCMQCDYVETKRFDGSDPNSQTNQDDNGGQEGSQGNQNGQDSGLTTLLSSKITKEKFYDALALKDKNNIKIIIDECDSTDIYTQIASYEYTQSFISMKVVYLGSDYELNYVYHPTNHQVVCFYYYAGYSIASYTEYDLLEEILEESAILTELSDYYSDFKYNSSTFGYECTIYDGSYFSITFNADWSISEIKVKGYEDGMLLTERFRYYYNAVTKTKDNLEQGHVYIEGEYVCVCCGH